MRFTHQKYENYNSLISDYFEPSFLKDIDCELDVPSLWHGLTTGDFTKIAWSDLIFENRKLIYACVNPHHNKLYIGQTNDISTRFHQHYTLARKHSQLGAAVDRFHSYMAHNSFQHWLMVPIFLPIDNKSEVDRIEKRFIKLFGCSTLNSQHVLLRSRFTIGPKYNTTAKSKPCVRYSRTRFVKVDKSYVVTPVLSVQRYHLRNTSKTWLPFKSLAFCYDLSKIFDTYESKNAHQQNYKLEVTVTGNNTLCTNWTTLQTRYGRSVVRVGNKLRTLKEIIPGIKNGSISDFEIAHRNLWFDEDAYNTVMKLAKSNNRLANRMLKHASFDTLFLMRKRIDNLTHHHDFSVSM
jgi:hypothetical protein